MTFAEIIERLKDGKAYTFTTPHLAGYFYKAPFPEDTKQSDIDKACSAITYYNKLTNKPDTPTLMLYDFTEPNWHIRKAIKHPLA